MSAKKLIVRCAEEDEQFPACAHGPTVLFYHAGAESSGHFACAAYRDKKNCNFYMLVGNKTKNLKQRSVEWPLQKCKQLRAELLQQQTGFYCHDCNEPFWQLPMHANHRITTLLSAAQLQNPTEFLQPVENEKTQAQYFFNENALQFIVSCLRQLRIHKVICMGAPRLHAYLRMHCKNVQTFLLDLDWRYMYFLPDTEFAVYNMCNNHFFDETQRTHFEQFAKCSKKENLLIFTDPPFACRTELIVRTLHALKDVASKVPYRTVPIFWIFPYFMEHYICSLMPEMQMCDYKMNYSNHLAYADVGKKSRKLGSPVRLYTNVPLEMLHLPVREGYKYCVKCRKYTALENRHCNLCETCPAKNGATYRHCNSCAMCVKPYYVHCQKCRRCTQLEGHNCNEYQAMQHCWICLQLGHTERNCSIWQKQWQPMSSIERAVENGIICMLCMEKNKHNERCCPKRAELLKESDFMGEIEIGAAGC